MLIVMGHLTNDFGSNNITPAPGRRAIAVNRDEVGALHLGNDGFVMRRKVEARSPIMKIVPSAKGVIDLSVSVDARVAGPRPYARWRGRHTGLQVGEAGRRIVVEFITSREQPVRYGQDRCIQPQIDGVDGSIHYELSCYYPVIILLLSEIVLIAAAAKTHHEAGCHWSNIREVQVVTSRAWIDMLLVIDIPTKEEYFYSVYQ